MRIHELLTEDGKIVKGVNTTVDVAPDEIVKQAIKFGNKVNVTGTPKNDMWGSAKKQKKDPRVK